MSKEARTPKLRLIASMGPSSFEDGNHAAERRVLGVVALQWGHPLLRMEIRRRGAVRTPA